MYLLRLHGRHLGKTIHPLGTADSPYSIQATMIAATSSPGPSPGRYQDRRHIVKREDPGNEVVIEAFSLSQRILFIVPKLSLISPSIMNRDVCCKYHLIVRLGL